LKSSFVAAWDEAARQNRKVNGRNMGPWIRRRGGLLAL